MGTISITTPSDGQTIDASDVATPLNTIVTEINGSLDSNNIADGGVVPNSLTSGTGTSWAWQDWTPSYTNLTVGNGTVVAKYIQIGKTVHFYWLITAGSTTAISNGHTISLPVTGASVYSTSNALIPIGTAIARDVGTSVQIGNLVTSSATLATAYFPSGSGSTANTTFPITEANGDVYAVSGTYEAA